MAQSQIIIGAGIAGLVTALELLQAGRQVILLECQGPGNLGGLARQAFGGMCLVDTPEQQKMGIKDSPEQALADWHAFGELPADPTVDTWPKAWARFYVEHCREQVYDYVRALGCRFLPAVNWVERGDFGEGNSLPRYHVLWGTSQDLVKRIVAELSPYVGNALSIRFEHRVDELLVENNRVSGCRGQLADGSPFEVVGRQVIVASGGFTGCLDKVRRHWPEHWGAAPTELLNGSHPSADGRLQTQVARCGGAVTHLDKMWNYAAGIPHPQATFDGQGLSLIPCKSALWLDPRGRRIGPHPLVTGFNTTELCRRLAAYPYSWQLLNWRIAAREFAISGADHNPMIRDRRWLPFIKELLLGNHRLVKQMAAESDHFLVADTLPALAEQMNQLCADEPNAPTIDPAVLAEQLADFDAMVARPPAQWNDDQLRRIAHARQWRPDRLRTCTPKPLLDRRHGPLIAIKVRLISRKSLGGIQTDLGSRVLTPEGHAIDGLYAVGEAAGFGGGGASGARSLEGTFLAGCILTARQAARHILQPEQSPGENA